MSYDSNPKKRLKAAQHLSESDSPFSTFALLELVFDKDEEVREYVKKVLKQKQNKKDNQNFLLSDLLTQDYENEKKAVEQKKKKIEEYDKIERIKKKLEPIIEDWIEAQDPEKREMVKKKVMPMVEQIIKRWADKEDYLMELFGSKQKNDEDNAKESDEDIKVEEPEEFDIEDTKKYLEMISSVEKIAQKGIGIREVSDEDVEEDEGKDRTGIEEIDVEEEVEAKDNPFIDPIDRAIYNHAIKIVEMPGITKKMLSEQKKQLKKELQLKVDAVFSLATIRAGHRYIEWLDELEEGMKNIYTKELEVVSVEDRMIKPQRGRSKELRRIVVSDGQNEFPVYLWRGRGKGIFQGEKVRLENAEVETFPITGETALTLNKKGSAIIVIK